MSYNDELQSNNAELEEILQTVNELPDAGGNAVQYVAQKLTPEQQAQARENIGLYANYVTPEMYGAVGDGTTDDSTAFTNAILSGKKVICDGTKTYYFANPIDARSLYQGYLDGNHAWFVNFHLYVNLNDNLTDWRHAYSSGRFVVENMNFGRRDAWDKIPEGWETPLITTGAPMTIRNINTRYPYVLATADRYIDHMQFDTWTRLVPWEAFVGHSIDLDTVCCLNNNGVYCRFDSTSTLSAAGDSWNLKQCNEFHSTEFPEYKFMRVTNRQPIVAESCVQSAFEIGLYSKAVFVGCHWESCSVTFTSNYLVKALFSNCFFYNNYAINNNKSTIYQNCYFRATTDATNSTHTLADLTGNVSFYDMKCVLENCCFGENSLIDTRTMQSYKHAPKKTYNWRAINYRDNLSNKELTVSEYTGASPGVFFPETGQYTYDIYFKATSLPDVAIDSATKTVLVNAIKSRVGFSYASATGGFSVVMIRTAPSGDIQKTEFYANPNEYDDVGKYMRFRIYDYGSYVEFQLVDGRPEYPMPWVSIDEKPIFVVNNVLYEANGALVTSDGSSVANALHELNGSVLVNRGADSSLSPISTNAVQNKAVTAKIQRLERLLYESIYPGIIYWLPDETKFDGTENQQIVTDVKLFDSAKDFTIYVDATGVSGNYNKTLLDAARDSANTWVGGVQVKTNQSWYGDGFVIAGCPTNGGAEIFYPSTKDERTKLAVIYVQGVPSKFYYLTESADAIKTENPSSYGVWEFLSHDGVVVIGSTSSGGERFVGTIHALEIYDYAMTQDKVAEKLVF